VKLFNVVPDTLRLFSYHEEVGLHERVWRPLKLDHRTRVQEWQRVNYGGILGYIQDDKHHR